MDLRRVLEQVHEKLQQAEVAHALIGGLAMAVHATPRATEDVGLLVDGDASELLHQLLTGMGYAELYRSEDIANYRSEDQALGRIDAVFARRRYAREMLERARPAEAGEGFVAVPVVDAADLIGLKVQASSNDPQRRRGDLADIEALLREARDVDLDRVRVYFRLFDREKELDALLEEVSGFS